MTPPRRLNAAAILCALAAVAATAFAASREPGYSASVTPGLMARYEQRFGAGVRGRIDGWKAFITSTAGQPALLDPVNAFFNRVPSTTDASIWNVEEYWATPAEMLSINGADCEDYAIAKYYALKELGIPVNRLRMVYAKQAQTTEAHMVLAYYPEPRADPLILDILDGTIRPASRRPDLTPVYSFNDDDLLLVQPGKASVRVDNFSNRKWKELLEKLGRELAH
ncbi:MAG: transglutaminase-like cysteine peptidase [Lysobacter sp.]|nr:transglutaminase-like cysteine peptidase [Lysobacter sp.]